jgi:hypothetical protein
MKQKKCQADNLEINGKKSKGQAVAVHDKGQQKCRQGDQ